MQDRTFIHSRHEKNSTFACHGHGWSACLRNWRTTYSMMAPIFSRLVSPTDGRIDTQANSRQVKTPRVLSTAMPALFMTSKTKWQHSWSCFCDFHIDWDQKLSEILLCVFAFLLFLSLFLVGFGLVCLFFIFIPFLLIGPVMLLQSGSPLKGWVGW